jgi:hypothetical protein
MPTGLGGERLWLCPTLDSRELLDLSGNGNHATYNGGMGTVADKSNGGSRAYSFNGVNNYISGMAPASFFNYVNQTLEFSFSLWGKTLQTSSSNSGFFGSDVATRRTGFGLLDARNLSFPHGTRFDLTKGSAGNYQTIISDSSVLNNDWHHFVVTGDGSSVTIYKNGSPVASQSSVSTITNAQDKPMIIGGYYGNGTIYPNFYGYIDDFRAFKRAISPSEIKHLASKRGVLGSPHSPIKLKSHITKLVSDRDDSIKPNLLSINKPKRSEPSYKSGYAKSASESASPHLWDGLVGAWMPSLGVTDDTLRDVSGRENHADYITAYGEKANWEVSNLRSGSWNVSHLSNRSWQTSGGDDLGTTSVTASFWVYVKSLRAGAESGFIEKTFNPSVTPSATNVNFEVYVYAGYLLARFSSATNYNHVLIGDQSTYGGSNTPFPLNQWLHIAVTYDETSGTARLYRNAQNVVTVNGTPAPLRIGDGHTTINGINPLNRFYLDGLLNSMLVHNRALSPQEIQELYVDSLAPFRQKSIRIFGGVGIPTDTSKIITVKRSKHVEPSYKSGYAQSAGESAHPNLWDGLVGAWMPSMGITGKTLRDVSGNGNHGTFEGGTSWGTNHQERSIYLDGNDDWVSGLGDVSLSASQPFSVTAKVKLIDYVDYYPTIFQIKTDTNYSVSMFLSVINGYQGLNFGSAQTWYRIRTGSSIAANETNFFVITYNGKGAGTSSNFSIFQNGVRKSFVGSSAFNTTSQDNYIGTTNNSSRVFDDFYGHINSASIYNRVLSPQEIQTLYVDSLAPFRKKQQVAFNAYPLTLLEKIRSAVKPTTPVSVRVKHNEEPSYKAGYAKSADESASPHLWNGLVGAWMPSLGVTGDTLRDVSGNRNHGTLTGMDAATDWVATSKGLALDFDGTDDHVVIPTFGRDLTSQATVSCIFRPAVVDSTWRKAIIQPFTTSWSPPYYRWQIGTYQNKLFCGFNVNNNYVTGHLPDTDTASSGDVYYVVGTFKNGVIRLFVNGILKNQADKSSIATTIISGSTDEVCIGRDASYFNQERLNGNVYQASIYNRALSPQEIQELYVDSLAPFRRKKSPIGYQPNKELRGLFKV